MASANSIGRSITSNRQSEGGSMSKHTEGPWNVSNHNSDYIEDSDRKLVACVWGSSQELEANARLIAAAPELLEALIDCRRTLEIANFTQELAVVNAAIAKAKGEIEND